MRYRDRIGDCPRRGQLLPQQSLAATSGVWLVTPESASFATRLVPVLKKLSPLDVVGLAPPSASFAIDSTPKLAILPGYCAESAANFEPT